MWEKWSNFRLSILRSIANTLGYEISITVDEHEIDIEFVDPESVETKAFDEDLYVSGNIFYKDYANPVKFDEVEEDDSYDLITSERYKSFMEQSLIQDIVDSSKETTLTLLQATIIILIMQMLTVGLVVFF